MRTPNVVTIVLYTKQKLVPPLVAVVCLLANKWLLLAGVLRGPRRANRLTYQELQHLRDVEVNKNGAQLSAIFFS
jgi:hypothetical protein